MCNVSEGIPFLMTFKHLNEKVKKTFKVFSKILSISHVPCVQDCNGNIENCLKENLLNLKSIDLLQPFSN